IAFLVDVRDKSVDFLEPGDMTALFGNLLENAVEAAQDLQGAKEPYLELMVDARPGSLLVITLVNSCREAPRSDGRGGFLTRKAPGAGHGTGMKSIRDTVEKYGGTMRQYYEEEGKLFHTVILLK
ncbi:MAG: ATP-binding protein, partial [Lachnospiraceae bacterium]|nr:ATP-binding protein [Lachnospiraceae bacterium]